MIDPACGSGHFLLGSFARLLDRWRKKSRARRVGAGAAGARRRPRRGPESLRGRDRPVPAAAGGAEGVWDHAAERCAGVRDSPRLRRFAAARQHRRRSADDGMGPTNHVYQPEDPEALELDCCGPRRITRWSPTRRISRRRIGAEPGVPRAVLDLPHDSIRWRCRSWSGSSRLRWRAASRGRSRPTAS